MHKSRKVLWMALSIAVFALGGVQWARWSTARRELADALKPQDFCSRWSALHALSRKRPEASQKLREELHQAGATALDDAAVERLVGFLSGIIPQCPELSALVDRENVWATLS